MAIRYALFIVLLLLGCQSDTESPPTDTANALRPDAQNPRYWSYQGDPVLLVGGSKEDNLFQIPDLEAHLDQLVAVGGNYVRNTMSARDDGNVWAFHQQDDGRYDLSRLSDTYYQRLEELLQLAYERDVIVQIELWDRFDFAREPWLSNPFRPANNINYTTEESGLANQYQQHPNSNQNPFFRSVPEQDNNQRLLQYQRARVDRILDLTLAYPNVLYVMDNETSANADWGAYWARFIKDRAAAAGVPVHVTEMWDAWDIRDEQHRRTLDHPTLYDFADISQNNHNTDQTHWDNLQWVWRYTESRPWVLNNVKIYGADSGPYGTTRDATERFWRNIMGGGASVRFHRPTIGLGLDSTAQAHIRSARQFTARYDLFAAQPGDVADMLSDRSADEAYVSHVDDQQYAVYFTDGGSVQLHRALPSGEADRPSTYRLHWLDIGSSRWQEGTALEATHSVSLQPPGRGHWMAVLTKEDR
jgi:hypothetical protein